MTLLPLTFLDHANAQQVKELPAEDLHALKKQIQVEANILKSRRRVLHDALALKYGDALKAALYASHRDTGTVRLHDGSHVIVAEMRKKVQWDHDKLVLLVEDLALCERAPVISVRYVVDEKHYQCWPRDKQALLHPARTVTVAAPTFTFEKEHA